MLKKYIVRYCWRSLIVYWINQVVNFDTKQFDVSAYEREVSDAIQLLEDKSRGDSADI